DRADRSCGVPARPLVVVERVLGCLTPALVPAEQRALRVAGEEPRTSERAIVCRGLEYRDCLARDSQELLRPNRGARRQLVRDELDLGAALHAAIARSERRLERPAKDLPGSVEFARGAKCQSELAEKLTLPFAARQQRGCPVEQIQGRRHVSSLPGANSGASEPVAG